MSDPAEGFFLGYFSSKEGYGGGLFVLTNGKIVGADAEAVRFDGTYRKIDRGHLARVTVTVPANIPLLQGGESGPEGLVYDVSFEFANALHETDFIRAETPRGPVNVRFVRLRGLND